jgi:fructoselysine-6-P-deglycase FrlB-like protein
MTGELISRATGELGADMAAEIASQPDVWERVLREPAARLQFLPGAGQAVAVVGCGTSYYIGDAYARLRERLGSASRAAIASEFGGLTGTEVLLVISRSGTTGDVLRIVERYRDRARVVGIVGAPDSPLVSACHDVVMLDYADEASLVQTRFATSALTLLRRSLGENLSALPGAARTALRVPVEGYAAAFEHFVFLGSGEAMSLAAEAALKCIEASGAWAEAYATGEYLHGPVAAAGPRSLVWALSPAPDQVAQVVAKTGATLRQPAFDPQVELVICQRLALALALVAGRDPDHPPYLNRSVT